MNARTRISAIRSRSNAGSLLDIDGEAIRALRALRYSRLKQPAVCKHGFSISPRKSRESCLGFLSS
jgi:hypothetical protein